MEKVLKATEELVNDLQDNTEELAEMERQLQSRLASISQSQLAKGRDIQSIADAADAIRRRQETYRTKAKQVQTLIEEMKHKLEDAKSSLRSAEFPLGDAVPGSDFLSTLAQTATSLADKHQTKADAVQRSANAALSDSERSLALVRTLMNKENKVKELISDLKAMYEDASSRVKVLESRAAQLGGDAKSESKMADGMLKEISRLEKEIPSSLQVKHKSDKISAVL
ncbi:hypothetical protein LDENG_00266740 [Lucifuga dentata]|nr:hypothetical protein LDENG_00266740 [Lucifuga dentata]